MNKPALLTAEDTTAIRAELRKTNPKWDDFSEAELQSMAEDATEGCAPGCSAEDLRRAVVRIASLVAAETGLGED